MRTVFSFLLAVGAGAVLAGPALVALGTTPPPAAIYRARELSRALGQLRVKPIDAALSRCGDGYWSPHQF